MNKLAAVLVGFVACLHVLFLVLEMFLWQTPVGLNIFDMTQEIAAHSAVLAKNQGLYNGFFAAALVSTYFISSFRFQQSSRIFILGCIIVAGVFGGLTAKFSIIFIQALPAFLALTAVKYTAEK